MLPCRYAYINFHDKPAYLVACRCVSPCPVPTHGGSSTGTLTTSNFTQDVSIILRISRVLSPTLALSTCSPGGIGVPLSASPFNLVLQFHQGKYLVAPAVHLCP